MRRGLIILTVLLLSLVLVIGACAKPAPAPPAPAPTPPPAPKPLSPADFYAKEKVTLIVTFGAGGGTDYAGRLFASYWSEVAGGPMVIRNKTGGGGLEGLNFVYTAKPDGLTIGVTDENPMRSMPLLGESGVKYDLGKYNFIGSMISRTPVLAVSSKKPYESIEDLQKAKGLLLGALNPKDAFAIGGTLAAHILNLDAKIVTGYASSSEMTLALGRGEIDASVMADDTCKGAIDKGFAKPPLVVVDVKKSEVFPDTPTITEVVDLTPEQTAMTNFAVGITTGGKVFFAPLGVPQDKVEFLRAAFDQIVAIKAFVKQAKLRWAVWSKPVTGKEAAATVEVLKAVPEKDIAGFMELVDKYVGK